MTSKHYGWQKRWTVDRDARRAVHESGLIVAFDTTEPARAEAVNFADLEVALTAKHGPHNVPPMLARWLREAEQLFAKAES